MRGGMANATAAWPRLRDWIARHSAELRLSMRTVVAGALTFALAHLLQLPQGYWAVLTSVIVMQASVGGSLKATIDRLIGTVGGAAFGAVVATLVPHTEPVALGVALAIVLGPLGLLAALYPSFRIAPVTAIIVLLGTGTTHLAPFVSALDRVLEISLGSLVGLGVSLLVLPARAHGLVALAAGRTFGLAADLVAHLVGVLTGAADRAATQGLHDRLRQSLMRLAAVVDEAGRERRSRLTDAADPEPLLRTARRVRSDLVMIGRAAAESLPDTLAAALAPALARVGGSVSARFWCLDRRAPGAARARCRRPGVRRLCGGNGDAAPDARDRRPAERCGRAAVRARLRARPVAPGFQ